MYHSIPLIAFILQTIQIQQCKHRLFNQLTLQQLANSKKVNIFTLITIQHIRFRSKIWLLCEEELGLLASLMKTNISISVKNEALSCRSAFVVNKCCSSAQHQLGFMWTSSVSYDLLCFTPFNCEFGKASRTCAAAEEIIKTGCQTGVSTNAIANNDIT